jgi:hypothetical protein
MENLNFIHDVKLKPDANLLRLETEADIDSFTEEYGFNILQAAGFHSHLPEKSDGIRWDLVADKYQGILIPTYHWSRRMFVSSSWYYPWDCASGCIWDADAIESITCRSDISAGYEIDPEQTPEAIRRRIREAAEWIRKEQEKDDVQAGR